MKQLTNLEELETENLTNEQEKEIAQISEIIDNSDIEEVDKEKIYACIKGEVFKGPLPHPEILKQYEDIEEGFAKEIMQMAIREQEHRHEMETMIVRSETSVNSSQIDVIKTSIKMKSRLQIFGFVLTLSLVLIGTICIFTDKNIIVPFVLAIASFCWTMFYGKKDISNQGDEEKANDNSEK